MKTIRSHNWWRKRFLWTLVVVALSSFAFLMIFSLSGLYVSPDGINKSFQAIGIVILCLIAAAFFPPSKLKVYAWKISRRYLNFSKVSFSKGEALIETPESISFVQPKDISDVTRSSHGVFIDSPNEAIHCATMDDWDGSTLDEAKQNALFQFLNKFWTNQDMREVFEVYAKPMKQLKTRYLLGVLLPIVAFGAGLFFLLHDAIHPVVFKSIAIGFGVILAVDYRRRSRNLTERIANLTERPTPRS